MKYFLFTILASLFDRFELPGDLLDKTQIKENSY